MKNKHHAMWRVVGIALAVWLGICVLGATANYYDGLKHGDSRVITGGYWAIWRGWVHMHVPMFLLSCTLYFLLTRHPEWIAETRKIVGIYLLLAFCFYPLHVLYVIFPSWYRKFPEHSLHSLGAYYVSRDNFMFFLEFAWFTGNVLVIVSLRVWQLGQQRMHGLQQAQTANLELNLALEHQRLQSLRQQLEPHFIFNALNAISALVRGEEKTVALRGINELSELLRYALKASQTDLVCFSDEVRFLGDYLSLQSLRYGPRLQYAIRGVSDEIACGECPPLLLQPLVENALRHDLDCHDGVCRIDIDFALTDQLLIIQISNSLAESACRQPGFGMGLTQCRERLALMYGERACLRTEQSPLRFTVYISMPSNGRESMQ